MENKKTNTLAIVGFILSLTLGLPGLIVSIIALVKIKKTNEGGKELAIVGILVSLISTLIITMALISVVFSSLIWPGIKDDIIKDNFGSSVDCAKSFDCKETPNGYMLCSYCEDGTDSCTTPKSIICPIE